MPQFVFARKKIAGELKTGEHWRKGAYSENSGVQSVSRCVEMNRCQRTPDRFSSTGQNSAGNEFRPMSLINRLPILQRAHCSCIAA